MTNKIVLHILDSANPFYYWGCQEVNSGKLVSVNNPNVIRRKKIAVFPLTRLTLFQTADSAI